LRSAGFNEEMMWGHRVADRGIDFLERAGDTPFILAVSFDEPHGPFVAPPEYWERFSGAEIPEPPNFLADGAGKPGILQIQREQNMARLGGPIPSWREFVAQRHRWLGCNSYVDREIGRVIDAVDRLHPDDTMIIYTSDHGDQFGAHGLMSKGPMMYDETCSIPFIVRLPGGPTGRVSTATVSHVDILPTLLDYAGHTPPELLNGVSLRPLLEDPDATVRDAALISFHRFAINHDNYGEFYPIRCATDGHHKLIINLFESDEFYDLDTDPYEMHNIIDNPATAGDRDRLHDWLLDEMDRIRDTVRSFRWADRTWRSVRKAFYWGGKARPRPEGFPFQPTSTDG
jgi:uncharacterized sulfatase